MREGRTLRLSWKESKHQGGAKGRKEGSSGALNKMSSALRSSLKDKPTVKEGREGTVGKKKEGIGDGPLERWLKSGSGTHKGSGAAGGQREQGQEGLGSQGEREGGKVGKEGR